VSTTWGLPHFRYWWRIPRGGVEGYWSTPSGAVGRRKCAAPRRPRDPSQARF
jgi:hypothetical protein